MQLLYMYCENELSVLLFSDDETPGTLSVLAFPKAKHGNTKHREQFGPLLGTRSLQSRPTSRL